MRFDHFEYLVKLYGHEDHRAECNEFVNVEKNPIVWLSDLSKPETEYYSNEKPDDRSEKY